jgi:hypothetical protein
MNKAVEISLYTASGITFVVLVNAVMKHLNNGIGFLTTDRHMAKYAMTKPSGNIEPTTKEQWAEHYAWWKKKSKEYRREWYKAVWNSEHGKPTPTFKADGDTWKTKVSTVK